MVGAVLGVGDGSAVEERGALFKVLRVPLDASVNELCRTLGGAVRVRTVASMAVRGEIALPDQAFGEEGAGTDLTLRWTTCRHTCPSLWSPTVALGLPERSRAVTLSTFRRYRERFGRWRLSSPAPLSSGAGRGASVLASSLVRVPALVWASGKRYLAVPAGTSAPVSGRRSECPHAHGCA